MAAFLADAHLNVAITLILTEEEAAALEAMASYNTEEFIRVFYKNMGESLLSPHADGLRTLFAACRHELPGIAGRARRARKLFEES